MWAEKCHINLVSFAINWAFPGDSICMRVRVHEYGYTFNSCSFMSLNQSRVRLKHLWICAC